MILQVEAAVHVVDAVRDLVLVRHHAQVERLRSYIQYQLQALKILLPPTLVYEMMGSLMPRTPKLLPQNLSVL